MMISYEIPQEWNWQWTDSLSQFFLALLIILPPVFYAVGWVKGFPAWSYPYIAHVLQWSSYMTQAATPGLRIFNYTFGPRDLWGWRAWIPFALATGIALLISRSFIPLLNLIEDSRQDWTRYTFGILGFFPMWVFMSFDGLGRLYSLYFMVCLAVAMPVTAFTYLRSRSTRKRAAALSVGIFISVLVATAAPTLYWHPEGWLLTRAITMGITFLLVSFSPALITSLQKRQIVARTSLK
jgi:hypothetical protein